MGLALVAMGLIFTAGCTDGEGGGEDYTAQLPAKKTEKLPEEEEPPQTTEGPGQSMPEPPLWEYGGKAVEGRYADAEVVRLANGSYRMYYQDQGVIKSALSSDGLSWRREEGVRVYASSPELTLDSVGSPTVVRVNDSYIMVYRGTINQRYPYPDRLPNDNTQLFLWATSRDGLLFEKKGIALDSRKERFKGFLDGPEFVKWGDDPLRLYFCSYQGVFHVAFKGGEFSGVELDYTTASDPKNPFPPDPPGDPTLIRIGSEWFMYYGQHTEGIYYATLR